MVLKIGTRGSFTVADLRDASRVFGRERDDSGEGYSTWPDGYVWTKGKRTHRVSYNGRVWKGAVVVQEAVYGQGVQ